MAVEEVPQGGEKEIEWLIGDLGKVPRKHGIQDLDAEVRLTT